MEKQSLYHLVVDTVATFSDLPIYWIKSEHYHKFQAVPFSHWRSDMERFSAYLLHRIGLEQGEHVAIFCDNRYEWNLISLGIITLGAVDVPRSCDITHGDLKYILEETHAKIMVVENEKMLHKLLKVRPKNQRIEHIILIEEPKNSSVFNDLNDKLGKTKVHLLLDIFAIGDDLLVQHGLHTLQERGRAIAPDDLATIIYTSGTTGEHKGVMLSHRNLCWAVAQLQKHLPISEKDRSVVYLPPWYITERVLEMSLMSFGASMACSQLSSFTNDLQQIKPTILFSVPRVWEMLYKKVMDNIAKAPPLQKKLFSFAKESAHVYMDIQDTLEDRFTEIEEETPRQRLLRRSIAMALLPFYALKNFVAQKILKKVKNIFGGELRFAISGAGRIPERVALFFRSLGIPILDAYGMAETTALGVLGSLPLPQRDAVGKPFGDIQIQLRDGNRNVVSRPGVPGVLHHHGWHVMQGYYKNDKATQEVLRDGWLNSGDLFCWTQGRELRFLGRSKNTIVISSGENIEPNPIETKLQEIDVIQHAIVVGQDQNHLGALLVVDYDALALEFVDDADITKVLATKGDINELKKVRHFFTKVIKQKISVAKGFKVYEKVKVFYLISKPFTQGDELTASMKIKRHRVLKKYEAEIIGMF